jgi:uncharacterized protein YjbI with pentapeptide repeats
MADVYDLFAQGVAFWNQYRKAKPALHVELGDLDLSDSDCSGINLSGATFRDANLSDATLRRAILNDGTHGAAHFFGANTQGCVGCPSDT